MTDTEKLFIHSDRINVNAKNELEYWCEKYNVLPEVMKKTVAAVGPLVKDVEKRLRKK
jgi:hypothetical protein